MPGMTGGQALVRTLYREGVRTVFGIPGAGQYEAIDALWEEPRIRYISVRHEQATSYMADGYARASGEIAAAIVVPGPGLFNASAGMATAYAVSSPVLMVTSDHHKRVGERDGESASTRPITKWGARARNPAEVPRIVHEAFRRMKTGRPRPVEIDIPHAVLAAEAEVELVEPVICERSPGGPKVIERAARILRDAERPAIWAGGGVHRSDASGVLLALAEHLGAAVVTSREGKGAISDRHPLSLGMAELRYAPLREWLGRRDVILAVGTRTGFADRLGAQTIIRIDVDEAEIAREDHHTFGILADARCALEALHRLVSKMTPARPSCADELSAINSERFAPASQLEPQHSFMRAIRAAMPDDGILVGGMNQMGYYSRNYYPVYAPRAYFTASPYGTLGYAYPAAFGAKVARPDKAAVAISGDGGFLYNAQELATAVQYGINAVVVVFNDNAYGNVLRAQIEKFDGHILGTRLHNPDFVKLAEAYGARGLRADNADELEGSLRRALATDAPALIEVPVGRMDRVY